MPAKKPLNTKTIKQRRAARSDTAKLTTVASKLLTADDFLPKLVRVDLPERGGHVFMKEIDEQTALDLSLAMAPLQGEKSQEVKTRGYIDAILPFIARLTCDEKGEPIFTLDTVQRLRQTSGLLMRLALAIQKQQAALIADVGDLKNGFSEVEASVISTGYVSTSQQGAGPSDGSGTPN